MATSTAKRVFSIPMLAQYVLFHLDLDDVLSVESVNRFPRGLIKGYSKLRHAITLAQGLASSYTCRFSRRRLGGIAASYLDLYLFRCCSGALTPARDHPQVLKLHYQLSITYGRPSQRPAQHETTFICVGAYGKPIGSSWKVIRVAPLPMELAIMVEVARLSRNGKLRGRAQYVAQYSLSEADTTLGGIAACIDMLLSMDMEEHARWALRSRSSAFAFEMDGDDSGGSQRRGGGDDELCKNGRLT